MSTRTSTRQTVNVLGKDEALLELQRWKMFLERQREELEIAKLARICYRAPSWHEVQVEEARTPRLSGTTSDFTEFLN